MGLWTPKSNWRTLSLQLVVHFATCMSLLPPHFGHTVRIEDGRKWGVGCRTQNFAFTVCDWGTNRLSAHTWTKLQRCRGFSQHMIAPKSNLKCINLVFFYFPLSSPRVGESGRWSVGMDTGNDVGLLPVEPGEAVSNGTEFPYIFEMKSALDVALRCYQLLADSWRVAVRPGWPRE